MKWREGHCSELVVQYNVNIEKVILGDPGQASLFRFFLSFSFFYIYTVPMNWFCHNVSFHYAVWYWLTNKQNCSTNEYEWYFVHFFSVFVSHFLHLYNMYTQYTIHSATIFIKLFSSSFVCLSKLIWCLCLCFVFMFRIQLYFINVIHVYSVQCTHWLDSVSLCYVPIALVVMIHLVNGQFSNLFIQYTNQIH